MKIKDLIKLGEKDNAPINTAATIVGKRDFNFKDAQGNDVYVIDLRGLSSAIKPSTWQGTEVGVGSTFLEVDTGVAAIFDGTNWNVVS